MTECEHMKTAKRFDAEELLKMATKLIGEEAQTVIIAVRYKNQPHPESEGKEHTIVGIMGDGTTKTSEVIRLYDNIGGSIEEQIADQIIPLLKRRIRGMSV